MAKKYKILGVRPLPKGLVTIRALPKKARGVRKLPKGLVTIRKLPKKVRY
jgi:hypothetical protein